MPVMMWLYTSYDERTYCTPVMMRGPIVRQLWWEVLLYANYDERSYCKVVMMRGPIVRQLWWEDLLYASYDERTYSMAVMRGPIVCQLWCEDILYASYDVSYTGFSVGTSFSGVPSSGHSRALGIILQSVLGSCESVVKRLLVTTDNKS